MRIPFQIDPSTPYSDVESEEERKEAEGVVNSVEISNYGHLPVVDTETVIAKGAVHLHGPGAGEVSLSELQLFSAHWLLLPADGASLSPQPQSRGQSPE